MADIRVDYGTVATAQENIRQGSETVNNTLENMEAQLAPLVEQWTGDASNAYHVAKANWDEALKDMSNVLIQIRNLLGESSSQFNSTDIAGANRFGG